MLETNKIYHGNNLDILPLIDDNSVDLMVTDPPYGISFMGKDWDKAIPSIEIWKQCLRVLKSGSFAFIFCIPRQDCLSRMIISLEDAGFNINFTSIYHVFASGFPKAENISKMVDKRKSDDEDMVRKYLMNKLQGIDKKEIANICNVTIRQVDHWMKKHESQPQTPSKDKWEILISHYKLKKPPQLNWDNRGKVVGIVDTPITWHSGDRLRRIATTPQAKALDGYYTFSPKPALEVVIVAQKPMKHKTYVKQALDYANQKLSGKISDIAPGCVNFKETRIPYENKEENNIDFDKEYHWSVPQTIYGGGKGIPPTPSRVPFNVQGRFPANLLVSDDVLNDGKITNSFRPSGDVYHKTKSKSEFLSDIQDSLVDKNLRTIRYSDSGSFSRYFSLDAWWSERIKKLPKDVQKTFPFLIVPKAPSSEKWFWCSVCKIAVEYKNKEKHDKHNTYCSICKVNFNSNNKEEAELHINHKIKSNIVAHPTVKSISLISYLIILGSREGDIILDPFIGSGTTAIACRLLLRNFIGIEIEKEYFDISIAKIAPYMNQKTFEDFF